MKSPKEGKLIWHLTALDNIESIFENGLLSRKALEDRKFVDIANADILEMRERLGLDHVIPFHFFPKTPFAGGTMKANADKEFIYLVIQRELAIKNDFKIITKHPLNKDALKYDYLEGFEKIEWELMEDDNRNYHIKHVVDVCHAECIGLFDSIPIDGFNAIHVKTVQAKEKIDSLKKKFNINIHVDISPYFFV